MSKRSLLKLVTGSSDEEPDEEMDITDETGDEGTPEAKDTQPTEEWMESEGQLTVDVYQTTDEMVIKSTVAGVTNADLDITITNDMITIKGHRKNREQIEPKDYYYQELYWGQFSRSVILPQEIDAENAKASLKDGILTVRLPKWERSRTKKLKIS